MTGDLATLFEGKEITVTERDGELWFSLSDLAAAWGIDRKTPGNLLARNPDLFAGMFLSDGDVTYHDVNERGLYLLMGKISADRLKNPEAKTALIRFQRWVPELIQKYRKKEITEIPPTGPALDIELAKARRIAEATGRDPAPFQKIALGKCGLGDYAPALDSSIPAVVHGEPGWFNPTQLVARCNDPLLTAERLNWYLKNHEFQYRDGYIWRLTPRGMEHGKEYLYTAPSQHQEIRIAWRESVLYASGLKRQIPEDQMALPARA